jgi:cysteine desulfurase / selenocysteine lyase
MRTDIRSDFPILDSVVNGAPLVYLDNAATTQKPRQVIDAIANYYRHDNANVHRAAHALSERATRAFEATRAGVQQFINAADTREVIFTRGTTESINLVANVLSGRFQPGDEILISHLEHHANIVPWQMLAARTGAHLRACAITDEGDIDIESFRALLSPRTRLVAIGHVSNALGTVNPVEELVRLARAAGALVLIDGAQAVAHFEVDVQRLDCDFYAFSAHKLFGPTGVGVLWGRLELLESLPPWQGGGEMIEHVTLERSTWQQPPYRFEAGTPNIAGVIGLGAAIDYVRALPRAELLAHEQTLVQIALDGLSAMPGVRLIGRPRERVSVISFLLRDGHPHDVGTLLDQQGIAVRTGHHCAMPLMQRLGIPGTARASFSLYNSRDDVERLLTGIEKTLTFL